MSAQEKNKVALAASINYSPKITVIRVYAQKQFEGQDGRPSFASFGSVYHTSYDMRGIPNRSLAGLHVLIEVENGHVSCREPSFDVSTTGMLKCLTLEQLELMTRTMRYVEKTMREKNWFEDRAEYLSAFAKAIGAKTGVVYLNTEDYKCTTHLFETTSAISTEIEYIIQQEVQKQLTSQ